MNNMKITEEEYRKRIEEFVEECLEAFFDGTVNVEEEEEAKED